MTLLSKPKMHYHRSIVLRIYKTRILTSLPHYVNYEEQSNKLFASRLELSRDPT